MHRIVIYILTCLFLMTGCVCANPADGAGSYSDSEGSYINGFGQFNNIIGAEWEQTTPFGYSEFHGRDHMGVDIGADEGTPLKAAGVGVVKEAGWGYDPTGYGCLLTVNYPSVATPDGSGGGMDILFGHLAGVCVAEGDIVQPGQVIAYLGNTGHSTGPHVHLEVIYGNSEQRVDPALYFSDLKFGSGAGSGGGGGEFSEHMPSAVPFELKADLVKPVRDIIEAIIKAATAGLKLIEGGMRKIFMILLTIDLAFALIFYNIDKNMHERTPFFAFLCFKFLFYGFLLYLLSHWGDFVGNVSKNLFSEAGAIMSNRSPEEVAVAISSPTDVVQKGLHIISPIFSQLMSDASETLFIGSGVSCLLAFIILILFLIIGWQVAKAYIEFYMMVLFGFTTFIFAGEKHTRIHAENGINGIVACSINLMFFCFFSITLQGMMADIAMDSVFTVGGRAGQTITYKHPVANDPDNAGIPPGAAGLQQFMAKIRTVESFGGRYYCYCNPEIRVDSETYGAYQVLNSGNWNQWAQEYIDDTGDNPPLDKDFSLVPSSGYESGPPFYEGPPPSSYQYPATPRNQDLICGNKMLRLYAEYGSWRGVAEFWGGDRSGEYWAKVSGASTSAAENTAVGRSAINMFVLLKLLLLVIMFMLLGDRIAQAIMNSFGGRGFTFRMNS